MNRAFPEPEDGRVVIVETIDHFTNLFTAITRNDANSDGLRRWSRADDDPDVAADTWAGWTADAIGVYALGEPIAAAS